MALVIFCVALVEAMRTRISLSEAILSPPRRSDPRSDRKPLFRHARLVPVMTALCKRLGETLDHRLQLGGGIVREVTGVADGVEDVGVLAAQHRQQAVLERPPLL